MLIIVPTILRCVAAACLTGAHSANAAGYGVGFGLSLDYGVASIYFSNGSSVDIANIEGGATYKQAMRSPDSMDTRDIAGHPTFDESIATCSAAAQTPLDLQSLRDYLPPWLGGQDPYTRSLSRMLKALKTATESYLEAPLSDAEVVVPFPASQPYLVALRAAASSLSLRMPMSAQPPAGILAARAQGIGGQCNFDVMDEPSEQASRNDPEQLILTVDYSRAALTVLLVSEECSIFESRRVLHDTSLGAESLANARENPRSDSGRTRLARALREVMKLPLRTGTGAGLTDISELVVVGESANDPRLHDALMKVFFERSDDPISSFLEGRAGSIHPVFAASRGVAQDCWGRLKFESDNNGRLHTP